MGLESFLKGKAKRQARSALDELAKGTGTGPQSNGDDTLACFGWSFVIGVCLVVFMMLLGLFL